MKTIIRERQKNTQPNIHQADHRPQTNPTNIDAGSWVFDNTSPTTPMYVSKMLGYGMCEVIYGKSLPFRRYKRRVTTLRPLTPKEMYITNNAMCREIEHVAKSA